MNLCSEGALLVERSSGQSTNDKLTDELQKIAVAESCKCLDTKTPISCLKFNSGPFEFFTLLAWYQI